MRRLSYDGWRRHLKGKSSCELLLTHLKAYCRNAPFAKDRVFRGATQLECQLALIDLSVAQLQDPEATIEDRLVSVVTLLSMEQIFFTELIPNEHVAVVLQSASASQEILDANRWLINRVLYLRSGKPANWSKLAADLRHHAPIPEQSSE